MPLRITITPYTQIFTYKGYNIQMGLKENSNNFFYRKLIFKAKIKIDWVTYFIVSREITKQIIIQNQKQIEIQEQNSRRAYQLQSESKKVDVKANYAAILSIIIPTEESPKILPFLFPSKKVEEKQDFSKFDISKIRFEKIIEIEVCKGVDSQVVKNAIGKIQNYIDRECPDVYSFFKNIDITQFKI